MTAAYIFDGAAARALDAATDRALRWAAWRPGGAEALVAGNRGAVLRFDGERFEALDSTVVHNLRGVAWSPDGERALLAGNRGAVLLYDGASFRELPAITDENLRRVAWSPDGASALIVGNGGRVLRYDAKSGALHHIPGDRAHTLRSIAWRPDGAYALIGGYASPRAGYPPPAVLYRCDGRYTQAILATDDEDDAIAIDWQPGADPPRALALVARYAPAGERLPGKIVSYDGHGFAYRTVPRIARASGGATKLPGGVVTLLGLAWHPSGDYALLCGERGKLLSFDGQKMRLIPSGTTDTLVGPFWRPGPHPIALMLRGPADRVYTV
jgi:hypothetical protein